MTTIQFNNHLLGLQDKLRYFALSLTANDEDAQDLLQETILKALTYRNQFTANTNFKAWVFTIMKNTFINNYRRNQKTKNTFDGGDDANRLAYRSNYASETPEMVHSVTEMNRYIDQLEDEFRIPFKMHTDGYKYKEIAEQLDLPIGTVKSRIFFTRKKLQEMLKDREGSYVY
ncbi:MULTISPECIES: RNA polymerase sigma factor [Marinilabiliaceae]|uniref:RNA polymerase sigma-70 factor, ECF subfamily n=2 Tax=Marinilabiliaceae TaxID=558415 RepID=A0A1T5HL46_9BACT|nr:MULTISPECIES: RNA polymerase sigma factor [Marinilabiliaceae]ASB47791.1 RNA polymerase subunit sigma [Alkalitalea saponilacus]TCO05395.1 RNA polymerase sigma-70 factor (ECF subfamily) [Natronoflexus pectinivorans]SKC21271.1 RNA polymerase sigma-70 factor, ECF subfamily [Alkalitalea saponilacus]